MAKTTKREPQDLTLRNLRAMRKALAALTRRVWRLEHQTPKMPWFSSGKV